MMRTSENVRKGNGSGRPTIARLTNKKDDGGLWVRGSGMSIQTGKIALSARQGWQRGRPQGLRGFFGGGDIARSLLEPEASGSVMHLVEFDADVSPPRIMRCEECGAGTAEWIKNDAAARTESVDKRFTGPRLAFAWGAAYFRNRENQ